VVVDSSDHAYIKWQIRIGYVCVNVLDAHEQRTLVGFMHWASSRPSLAQRPSSLAEALSAPPAAASDSARRQSVCAPSLCGPGFFVCADFSDSGIKGGVRHTVL
jgi:hypothetical protein